jgi:hypothetical protein
MRKLTLALIAFVGSISFATAQSTTESESTNKEVKTEKAVVLTEKKPAKEVKSVKMKNAELLPVKKEEAVIEEKKNQ